MMEWRFEHDRGMLRLDLPSAAAAIFPVGSRARGMVEPGSCRLLPNL